MPSTTQIPVTVLTGFLGSGKTTLLNRILKENHGKRIAVIENEFGEIGIDQDLVIRENEEIIEMNNGCICCTVRGDLIRIVKKLIALEVPPEYILIETTGLADPSPVAQTFITDKDICGKVVLDSIIALVDAKHVSEQIKNTPEAKDQIAFADVIIINKTDIVSAEELQKVKKLVSDINSFAKVYESANADIPVGELFHVHGFSLEKALEIKADFLDIEYPFEWGGIYDLEAGTYTLKLCPNGDEKLIDVLCLQASEVKDAEMLGIIANPTAILFSGPRLKKKNGESIKILDQVQSLHISGSVSSFRLTIPKTDRYVLFTQHLPAEFSLDFLNSENIETKPVFAMEFKSQHTHDSEVSSVGIEIDSDLDPSDFLYFVETMTRLFGEQLYRYKGIVSLLGENHRIVLQGVHMLFTMQRGALWQDGGKRKSSIVFIGKNLDRNILTQGFLACKRVTNVTR